MLKGFVIGILCFFLFLSLHVIIFHKCKIKLRFLALCRIFYALLPVYVILYMLIPADSLSIMPADLRITSTVVLGVSKMFNFLLGIFVYLFLFFGYCQFYFIIDRSISVRFMIEIDNSPQKALSLEELKKIYTQDYIFLRRLEHMVENGYLEFKNGKYINTRRGVMEAKLFKFLKEILHLGTGG